MLRKKARTKEQMTVLKMKVRRYHSEHSDVTQTQIAEKFGLTNAQVTLMLQGWSRPVVRRPLEQDA
jgi:DNA-binding transcriptional regulator LsrR (DeoR family)